MDQYDRLRTPNSTPRGGIPHNLPPPAPDPAGPNPPANRTGGPTTGPAPGGAPTSRGGGGDNTHLAGAMQHQLVSDFSADFWRGFEHVPQMLIPASESGDDSDDDQQDPLSYARMLSPYSKYYREIVQEHDKEAARNRELRMIGWVEEVARCKQLEHS